MTHGIPAAFPRVAPARDASGEQRRGDHQEDRQDEDEDRRARAVRRLVGRLPLCGGLRRRGGLAAVARLAPANGVKPSAVASRATAFIAACARPSDWASLLTLTGASAVSTLSLRPEPAKPD